MKHGNDRDNAIKQIYRDKDISTMMMGCYQYD